MENKKVLVCGSICYDRIMNFPGKFGEHILPDKIHMLNVSFFINKLEESFGGTGGNIAYNLSLLGVRPTVIGCVGNDFDKYENWMNKHDLDISLLKYFSETTTAGAYIMTDESDNQITGFYPGPHDENYYKVLEDIEDAELAIISPDHQDRMSAYVRVCEEKNIPFIYDPGQQIPMVTDDEMRFAIECAEMVICNDYEAEMIMKKIGVDLKELRNITNTLVITKGEKGSVVYDAGDELIVPSAKAKNASDPTGAGDAFRAGLMKGILSGMELDEAAKLAGLVSVYTVELYGTQTHSFTMEELAERYEENFGGDLEV